MSSCGTFCLLGLSFIILMGNLIFLLVFMIPGGFSTFLMIWPVFVCWIWAISGLFAMHLMDIARLKKITAISPQSLRQIHTVGPSTGPPPSEQQQSGDMAVITAGSNAQNEKRKRLLREARQGVVFRAFAAGIIPGVILIALYMTTFSYIYTLIPGAIAIGWLFLDISIQSAIEWRRWNKLYSSDGGIELGHTQAVESTEQNFPNVKQEVQDPEIVVG